MKPTKFAIAAIIWNPDNKSEVLAVLRPPNDDSLPNVWGLPAVGVKDGELPEEAIKRLGIEKISTDIRAVSFVGIKQIEREQFELILMDIEAELVGPAPSVVSATTTGTKYVEQLWVSDYQIFKEAASKGSLCTRIFLESQGMSWEKG